MADSSDVDSILNLDNDEKEKQMLKENEQIVSYFRRVFSSKEGKIVLRQILEDLHYFDICNSEDDVALNNYAKFLLSERLEIKNRMMITEQIIESGIN